MVKEVYGLERQAAALCKYGEAAPLRWYRYFEKCGVYQYGTEIVYGSYIVPSRDRLIRKASVCIITRSS